MRVYRLRRNIICISVDFRRSWGNEEHFCAALSLVYHPFAKLAQIDGRNPGFPVPGEERDTHGERFWRNRYVVSGVQD